MLFLYSALSKNCRLALVSLVGTECFAVLWLVVGLVWDLASSVGTERRSLGVLPVVGLVWVVALSVGTELRPTGMASVVTFSCPVSERDTLLPWSLDCLRTQNCSLEAPSCMEYIVFIIILKV